MTEELKTSGEAKSGGECKRGEAKTEAGGGKNANTAARRASWAELVGELVGGARGRSEPSFWPPLSTKGCLRGYNRLGPISLATGAWLEAELLILGVQIRSRR